MSSIFISYRIQDSLAWATILYEELAAKFGPDNVFIDKDSLHVGSWRDQILEEIQTCDIFLLIIGPNWAGATDANGQLRLNNPSDVHFQEIATAFGRPGLPILPVLVNNAKMPAEHELPKELWKLLDYQARSLNPSSAHKKIDLELICSDVAKATGLEPAKNYHQVSPPEFNWVREHKGKISLAAIAFFAITISTIVITNKLSREIASHNVVLENGATAGQVIAGGTIGKIENNSFILEKPKTTVAPTNIMQLLQPETPEKTVVELLGQANRSDGDIVVYNRLDNIYIRLVYNYQKIICSATFQLKDNASFFAMYPIDIYHLGKTTFHEVFESVDLDSLPDKESEWFPKGGNYASVTEFFGGAGQYLTYTFGVSEYLENQELHSLPHTDKKIDFLTVTGEECPLALRSGFRWYEYQ